MPEKKRSVILLAIALLGLAGSAAAVAPAQSTGAALEPAVEAVALEEPAAAPLCTDEAEAMETAASTVETSAVAAGIDYGLCSMSCTRCYGSYQCPYGEQCLNVHLCPR